MIRVTGPSLTSSTRISVRNRPVSDRGPARRQARSDSFDERFGVGRWCGLRPARPATLAGVAVQRELAHNQEGRTSVERADVHHAVGVVEHAQPGQLRDQPICFVALVGVGDADEDTESGADPADHLELGSGRDATPHLGRRDPLHDRTHGFMLAHRTCWTDEFLEWRRWSTPR